VRQAHCICCRFARQNYFPAEYQQVVVGSTRSVRRLPCFCRPFTSARYHAAATSTQTVTGACRFHSPYYVRQQQQRKDHVVSKTRPAGEDAPFAPAAATCRQARCVSRLRGVTVTRRRTLICRAAGMMSDTSAACDIYSSAAWQRVRACALFLPRMMPVAHRQRTASRQAKDAR